MTSRIEGGSPAKQPNEHLGVKKTKASIGKEPKPLADLEKTLKTSKAQDAALRQITEDITKRAEFREHQTTEARNLATAVITYANQTYQGQKVADEEVDQVVEELIRGDHKDIGVNPKQIGKEQKEKIIKHTITLYNQIIEGKTDLPEASPMAADTVDGGPEAMTDDVDGAPAANPQAEIDVLDKQRQALLAAFLLLKQQGKEMPLKQKGQELVENLTKLIDLLGKQGPSKTEELNQRKKELLELKEELKKLEKKDEGLSFWVKGAIVAAIVAAIGAAAYCGYQLYSGQTPPVEIPNNNRYTAPPITDQVIETVTHAAPSLIPTQNSGPTALTLAQLFRRANNEEDAKKLALLCYEGLKDMTLKSQQKKQLEHLLGLAEKTLGTAMMTQIQQTVTSSEGPAFLLNQQQTVSLVNQYQGDLSQANTILGAVLTDSAKEAWRGLFS